MTSALLPPLQGLHHVVALTVTAAGSNLTVSLLSGAGALVWEWRPQNASAGEAVHTWALEVRELSLLQLQ